MMSDEEAQEWLCYVGALSDIASYALKHGKDKVVSDLEKALESLKTVEEMLYDQRVHGGPDSE